jgi:uncharacterized protein (DUF1697 family)
MNARAAGAGSSVVMLRGINLGATNRVAMPALREALAQAGFENPRTYVQSGNIVLETDLDGSELSVRVEALITQVFGLSVPAVTRSGQELERVVAENPFSELAEQEPKRFQVSFLRGELDPSIADRLAELASGGERVAVWEREVYAWHPDGVARSKLALKLGAKAGLGQDVIATSRNWTTVLTLLAMSAPDGN